MNLFNFEHSIMAHIVERGEDYFDKSKVEQLMQVGPFEYVLEIEGTQLYEVFVEMDENYNIVLSDCTCPYDLGPHCKHEVAAYLTIRETMMQKRWPVGCLKEQLEKMEKEQLISLIVDFAETNESVHMRLSERLNDRPDEMWVEADELVEEPVFIQQEKPKYPDFMQIINKDPSVFGENVEASDEDFLKLGYKMQILYGQLDFLKKLEPYYEKQQWSQVVRGIAQEMKELHGADFWAYEQLLVQERLDEELLQFCQQYKEKIVWHYMTLNEQYAEEVELLFSKLIQEKAAAAKNRSHYEQVCELLEIMQHACGFDVVMELVDELMELYRRKRVFLELLAEV